MSSLEVKVVRSVAGRHHPLTVWPEGWPPPRRHDLIDLGDDAPQVDKVIWFPQGLDGSAPFVAVLVGA